MSEGLKFQIRMFISFPAIRGWQPCLAWAAHIGYYWSHMCDVTVTLWRHTIRGRLGDISDKDMATVKNNQCTVEFIWTVISIETQLTKKYYKSNGHNYHIIFLLK